MRFSSLTLAAALSAGALGQLNLTDPAAVSVLSVLATAIPPASLSAAAANGTAFASAINSELAAGNMPAWYQALPSDVKSLLPQLYPAPASTSAATTPPVTSAPVTSAPVGTISASPTGGNSTTVSSVASATLSATQTERTGATSSPAATGGAARATAVVGAGLVGLLGMLAL